MSEPYDHPDVWCDVCEMYIEPLRAVQRHDSASDKVFDACPWCDSPFGDEYAA